MATAGGTAQAAGSPLGMGELEGWRWTHGQVSRGRYDESPGVSVQWVGNCTSDKVAAGFRRCSRLLPLPWKRPCPMHEASVSAQCDHRARRTKGARVPCMRSKNSELRHSSAYADLAGMFMLVVILAAVFPGSWLQAVCGPYMNRGRERRQRRHQPSGRLLISTCFVRDWMPLNTHSAEHRTLD